MNIFFQCDNIPNVNYELKINSKQICVIDFIKKPSHTVEVDIDNGVLLMELVPVCKQSNIFRNLLNSFSEWIAVCLDIIFHKGENKEFIPKLCDYIKLYSRKKLELDAKNDSKIIFSFKSSKIKKYSLYKVSPVIKEQIKVKILKNEEMLDFNSKYLKGELIKYLSIYNFLFFPFLIVFGLAIVDSFIKSNVLLLIFLSVLYIPILLFYIFKVYKSVREYKTYIKSGNDFSLKNDCL